MSVTTGLIKGIHLISATLFYGWMLFSCLLFLLAQRTKANALQQKLLGFTLRGDLLLLILTALAVTTGSLLVPLKHYSFSTPWIIAAYFFVMITVVLLAINFSLKCKWYREGRLNTKLTLIYYLFMLVCIVIIAMIAHDAVSKHTLLQQVL